MCFATIYCDRKQADRSDYQQNNSTGAVCTALAETCSNFIVIAWIDRQISVAVLSISIRSHDVDMQEEGPHVCSVSAPLSRVVIMLELWHRY
jgi:hypothetical protein